MSRIAKYEKLLAKFDEMKEILDATPEFSPDWDIQTRLNHVRERVKGRIVIEKGILPAKPADTETVAATLQKFERTQLAGMKKDELIAQAVSLNDWNTKQGSKFKFIDVTLKKEELIEAILAFGEPAAT